MNIDSAVIVTEGDRRVLRLIASAQASFENPDVFVEGPEEVFFGRPRLSVSGDRRAVIAELAIDDGGKPVPDARPLRITLVDGKRAIETHVGPNNPIEGLALKGWTSAVKFSMSRHWMQCGE